MYRFRVGRRLVELVVLPGKTGLLLGPQQPEHLAGLAQAFDPFPGGTARLGVDRTTMVDLVDVLEQKNFAERRPDPTDRRRNIVQLTEQGRHSLHEGTAAALAAEQRFLATLEPAEAAQFTARLQRLVASAKTEPS